MPLAPEEAAITMPEQITPSNLLTSLPDAFAGEVFTDLVAHRGCRIERIVSRGQTTPLDHPYVQSHDEWVIVLAGSARTMVAAQEVTLQPGDHLLIPAGVAHRVTFTDPGQPTVWLAVHIGEADRQSAPDICNT